MGSFIDKRKPPADATKFVKEALKKMGLEIGSSLYGKRRLAAHAIDSRSWKKMNRYFEARKALGVSVAKIPRVWKSQLERVEALKDQEEAKGGTIQSLSCPYCGNSEEIEVCKEVQHALCTKCFEEWEIPPT